MPQQPNPNRAGVQVLSDNNPAGSRIGAEKNVFTGRNQLGKGADIASATSITLGNDGNYFALTGSTSVETISTEGWQVGSVIILEVPQAITIVQGNGNIGLQGGTNYNVLSSGLLTLLLHNKLDDGGSEWREMSGSSLGFPV